MSRTRTSKREVAQRGNELYERELRGRVETERNIGRVIGIDVASGDFEIGDDVLAVGQRLLDRRPNAELWFERIGYNAVYAVGGTLARSNP